jgi:hypothetical protein
MITTLYRALYSYQEEQIITQTYLWFTVKNWTVIVGSDYGYFLNKPKSG